MTGITIDERIVKKSSASWPTSASTDEWKSWREAMPEGVFILMQRRISVELVKARAWTLIP